MLKLRALPELGSILVDQPLVLISQIQRSGGTLACQLLDGHSQMPVHPRELHWGRPSKYHWPSLDLTASAASVFDALRERWVEHAASRGYEKLGEAVKATDVDLSHFVRPFDFSTDAQRDLFVRLAAEPFASQRQALNAYATSFFNAWRDYRWPSGEVRWWVAFTARVMTLPGNLERYLADYPDGRLLIPIRDPLNWYASASRHSDEYRPVASAAMLWRAAHEATYAAVRRYPERVMLLPYERLVDHTETTMRAVARFLGIDFEPILLQPTFNSEPIASNSSFQPSLGIDRSGTRRSMQVAAWERDAMEAASFDIYPKLLALAAGRIDAEDVSRKRA